MFRQVVTAIAVFSVLQFAAQPSEAKARRYTITQRHQILGAKINRMERAGELTLREARDLRDDNQDVWKKVSRMKSRNGGKLSYENIAEVERDLNKISNKIHKKALAKRVED
ncbi:MAG TPA: hypothetical protein EYN91_26590 [Candidatus Melainabacteria bacterium]|jgi:hypothetical protein|nr:hypothetical protein [Candidatus Melainabacteria bacterium]HIN66438.1 hypothetical protein [Candidatus Obscuribacterales bacterium]